MKKGIIFDLDGTLWDCTHVITECWKTAVLENGKSKVVLTQDLLKSFMGRTLDNICKDMLYDIPLEEAIAIGQRVNELEREVIPTKGGMLYADLEDTLKRLSNDYSLYIVSNCQSGYIESFYEAHGMAKYFEDKECPGDSGLLKSDNIRLIIEKNNIDAAVYIGDTAMDYEASKKAGIPFIHAAYGFGTAQGADAVINNFSELNCDLIEKVLKK